MRSRLLHVPPDEGAIERNRIVEPSGERLRSELTEWLDANMVVSMLLDTRDHLVDIRSAKLPPRIRPVLKLWGSIYVTDNSKPAAPFKTPTDRLILI